MNVSYVGKAIISYNFIFQFVDPKYEDKISFSREEQGVVTTMPSVETRPGSRFNQAIKGLLYNKSSNQDICKSGDQTPLKANF